MRRTLFVCFLAVAVLIPFQGASAQGVLPAVAGNWSSRPSTQPSITLDQAAGLDAPVIQEFGFKSVEQREYALVKGPDSFTLTLYQMVDPTAAYGVFTYLRPANAVGSKVAQYAAVSTNRTIIVVGNFVLDITGKRAPQSATALRPFVDAVKPKADPRPYPSIAEHLPPNGLIPGSERYALGPLAMQKYLSFGSGDWIGFSQGAEAVLARYRKGGQEVAVLIAEYPTQQIAAKRFEAMKPVVHPDPPTPETVNRVVGSLREADLIALAFAPRAGAFPDGLLREINFGHYVTSNEGKFKATELSMPVYIVGAFVGAGAIMLLAIFSGLGFALVRIVVKRFFPDKVFDRRKTMEVIQLGLSNRPVNMKDFY